MRGAWRVADEMMDRIVINNVASHIWHFDGYPLKCYSYYKDWWLSLVKLGSE